MKSVSQSIYPAVHNPLKVPAALRGVAGAWIVETSFWSDTGTWIDSELWSD